MQKEPETGAEHPDNDDAIAGALVEHELDASDPTEQRTRAILQLFRSLAIGKTIAVVGSGASVVYGYPDWGDLVIKLATELRSDSYIAKSGAESKLRQLKKALADNDYESNEQKRKKASNPKTPNEQNPLLSRDELLALCDEIASCLCEDSRKTFDKKVADLFERSQVYWSRENLLKDHPLKDQLEDLLSKPSLHDRKTPPQPEDLLPVDIASLILSLPIITEKPKRADLDKGRLINAPRNLLDPLYELRSRIGIHRFVTFNYDLEIEALLEDIDYPFDELTHIAKLPQETGDPEKDLPDRLSQSRLGGIARSISLSPENAPDLISIAAVPSSANDLIVHVHGAARRPKDMVVTQSRYNAMYYDDQTFRRGFEDARHLLFGGNAVLYVGLGLTEEDVMRPLRYLSTNLRNRPIFALVPLLSNENRAKAFEHRIKSNFGVNVITYGRAYTDIPEVWRRNEGAVRRHPLLKGAQHNFISLGAELRNIRESFLAPDGQDETLDKLASGLRNLSKKKKDFPRLHHGNALIPKIAKILLKKHHQENLLNKKNSLRTIKPGKTEAFVKTMQMAAITTALCNALEYMQNVTCTWQHRLRIWPSPGEGDSSGLGSHYGAVHQARSPMKPLKIDQSLDEESVGRILSPDSIHAGVRIFQVEHGKGRGTLFNMIKEKCDEREKNLNVLDWRAINLNHTLREKTVLSDLFANLDKIRFLCLQGADSLLDRRDPRPATLFLESFFLKLKQFCRPHSNRRGLHLILIVRSQRTAEYFSRTLTNAPYVPLKPNPLAIHDGNSFSVEKPDYWSRFASNYPRLAEAMKNSRWAFLAVSGAMENLHKDKGEHENKEVKSFLQSCDLALRHRLFSIDQKHHQAALCEVLLDERHRLIQRSMDIGKRMQVIVENIILKWMYAIPIPIDRITIQNIPEITKLKINSSLWSESIIENALYALKIYRFIFETDYDARTPQNSENSRYILHGAIRQLLGYRRGFTMDAPLARDHNSVGLSLMLMDGGPMLSAEDFASTCRLFDKLTALVPTQRNRVAIRSAYALIRATIHTQSAMRAGLVAETTDYSRSALHAHLRRLARLRSLSRRSQEFVEDPSSHPPVLYKECELWLLNELGVVRFLQGNMHDAVFAFRECLGAAERLKIGGRSMAEIDPSLGPRLSINLALCLIERARFHDAESLVDKALHGLPAQVKDAENPEYLLLWALLQGCRAQIQLLTAQLDSARETVKGALPIIEKLGALGAQAWLHSVQASASLACEAHDEADAAISLALAAARGAHRPDLILSLELSAIDIQLSASGYNRETVLVSLTRLENLERTALRLGSHRSRCSAMLIRSRALLTIEQMEPARETIIEAISIAQLNGMRLKRISGLILLVALMAQRGEREPARRLLPSVKLAANRAGYVRAVADIERLQQAMDIEGGVPQWAGFVSDFGSTDRRRSTLR
jgi:hypothetical protein